MQQHIDELSIRAYVAYQSLRQRLLEREEGQTAVEYAGILALVATVFLLLFGLHLDTRLKDIVDNAISKITTGKD